MMIYAQPVYDQNLLVRTVKPWTTGVFGTTGISRRLRRFSAHERLVMQIRNIMGDGKFKVVILLFLLIFFFK